MTTKTETTEEFWARIKREDRMADLAGEGHVHEMCNETHIGTVLGMQHPRWLDPHCVECGESIA